MMRIGKPYGIRETGHDKRTNERDSNIPNTIRRNLFTIRSCGTMSTIKTIKLTQAQLNMLRQAWNEYGGAFWEEIEQGEDKRTIKTFETIRKKLFE